MAVTQSFDITSGCDLQEVDNAVNQAAKEIHQRYDLKTAKVAIEFDRAEKNIVLRGPDEFKVNAVWDVLQQKMVRRQVPLRNLKLGDPQPAAGGAIARKIDLQQGIPIETARAIVKFIKEHKMKKVQAEIQRDQVRVSAPSRDDLQKVIALVKQQDFGVELNFGNYRSN
jgi:uncharacterized protein YajQ (UPF0234 family)